MSIYSKATDLRGRDSENPITPDFHGDILQDIAKATETVDTIADLRQVDTTQLEDGDVIFVRAHNSNGLSRGLGGGRFVWNTTPLFTLQENLTADQDQEVTTTALTQTIASSGVVGFTDQFYGDDLVFEGGGKATPVNPGTFDNRSYGEGETSIEVYAYDNVSSGEKAYFDDDNGMFIRPSYAGFNGEGYFIRVLDNGYVTPLMYGAIPSRSHRDASPYDSTSAVQSAFDALFPVKLVRGQYYVTSTLFVRRKKLYDTEGYYDGQSMEASRFLMGTESERYSSIYTDQDIDVVEFWSGASYNGIVDCRAIPTHTKRAFKVNAKARFRAVCNVYVNGSLSSLAPDTSDGTRAFEFAFNEVDPDINHYAETSYSTGCDIKVSCKDCYSGITSQTYSSDVGSGSFMNSNNFKIGIRNTKKPVELIGGSQAYTSIVGFYQSESGLLGTTEADFSVIYIGGGFESGYINIASWDMGAGNSEGLHDWAIDIPNAQTNGEYGSVELGPLSSNNYFYPNKIKNNVNIFTFGTRQNVEQPYVPNQVEGLLKKVEYRVTASEILNSFDTPIEILPNTSVPTPSVSIERVWIKNVSGSSSYGTNTSLQVVQNPELGFTRHVAATIDISYLPSTAAVQFEVSQYEGATTNSSSSDSLIRLEALDGNPTGGDREFDVVVWYYEIRKS